MNRRIVGDLLIDDADRHAIGQDRVRSVDDAITTV
jgi:hypothetical protein